MAASLGNFKNKRRLPDSRTIKKHSDIVRRNSSTLIVGGMHEKTKTGYVVFGFSGKSFETYFEYMLSNSATPVVQHPTKDKTIRILSGILFASLRDGDILQEVKAVPGDELILKRGISYSLSTSTEPVQLVVCQNSKYNTNLKVLDESSLVEREVPAHMLGEHTSGIDLLSQKAISPRKGSKAKEQLAEIMVGKKSPQIINMDSTGTSPEDVAAIYGKNTRPTYGRVSEEGAG
jgi:hypothetical protein